MVRVIRQIRDGGIRFEGPYATWKEASVHCTGYDAEDILAKVLVATLKVKRGESAFERDSVLFNQIDYTWPMLSGLMWAAARNKGRLDVLDFGGSLGSSYFQNRRFLQTLPELRWSIVEQAHYVEAGQTHIQDQHLHFYKTIDECLVNNQPNVILLSSVLQYLEDPIDLIKKLSAIKATCLIIDRTSFSNSIVDEILVQKVPASIYAASYPMWVFSISKFHQILDSDWQIITQYQCPEGNTSSKNGLDFSFQGMLLGGRK
jgi:putative methyltransferase (TIGR04325 family)